MFDRIGKQILIVSANVKHINGLSGKLNLLNCITLSMG